MGEARASQSSQKPPRSKPSRSIDRTADIGASFAARPSNRSRVSVEERDHCHSGSASGGRAVHPLLELDAKRQRSTCSLGDLEMSCGIQHPLLAFDPFAGRDPFSSDSLALSPQAASYLQLRSVAPADFASELDYHCSPRRSTFLLFDSNIE